MATAPREFTLARDYAHASTLGHRIVFKKGVKTHVPREIEHEVIAIGAVPVDGVIPELGLDDVDANPAINTGPDDPTTRKAEIKTAMKLVVEANQRADFAASGAPKTIALTRVLGFDVDARERDTVWTELKAERSESSDAE